MSIATYLILTSVLSRIPFAAPANSCCIFDRRLWHSATPNWSRVTRKVSAAAVPASTAAVLLHPLDADGSRCVSRCFS